MFARAVTKTLQDHPNVTIIREEVTEIPRDRVVIVASGPLTSEKLSKSIQRLTGERYFYFYDAAAPIVTYESINHQKVFRASRYGKGEAAYLNCPFTEEEYNRFYQELIKAERHPRKEFEKEIFFEGCMPVEVLAERGPQTLLFGPMKPVGLIDPRTGKQPYAVVQLRQDNREGTLYNIVGFQTNLKWGEQARVFRLIPGLENAEFVRYGVMHRNTFINSPSLLLPTLQLKKNSNIFFAGQITGVEGYVESASNGIVAGLNAARLLQGKEPLVFPRETVIGALCHYITSSEPQQFQPMNANFGLVPPFGKRFRNKREKNQKLAQRALNSLESFLQNIDN
ncbi:tRNA (uracil-5-)-methyltransferase [Calderihabitans maritimus]|uniref:tRNA (Uracil-5-)-methyltransferase n=1 Tax=Calderihabitans maritimus TaxID=1246530 RepID=A0A1Z5HY39_9FIRM|nr:tRNA (uracil-5-)-methyltransferase [Calderihabitans maritimus]